MLRRSAFHTEIVVAMLLSASSGPLAAIEIGRDLCPGLVASLTSIPGNLDSQFAAERIEIRQCPLNPPKLSGWVQLVAWEKDASKPTLVINAEDSGFYQYAVIPGVYAFEIIGGKASQLLVISFEGGVPRIVLQKSTISHPTIRTDAESLSIVLRNEQGEERTYRFRKTGVPSRRK